MKILFLTSRLPFPPVGGDKLRTYNFIQHLHKKHELTLISFIENEHELSQINQYRHTFDKIITIKLPVIKSYQNCLLGLTTTIPLQVHYYKSSKMSNAVIEEISAGYDVVFCHLIRMAQYLPEDQDILKVVDFTDAISLNYKRSELYRTGLYSLINTVEARRVYQYELETIRRSDIGIFISEVDANYLKNSDNFDKIKIVENGVNLEKFRFYTDEYNSKQLVFVGNMRTFPNTDAVLYFIKKVLPIIKEKISDIQFFVVGTEPSKEVLKLNNDNNIFVTGFVESVIPYLNNSLAMVAPMRVGAGLQNKILEAMAVGTPVITTDIGAEGLDSSKVLLGNKPRDIADHIINLATNSDFRNSIAIQGRNYIEMNFQWDKILNSLDEYLDQR